MSGYPITFLGMALISSLSSSICIMITKQNVQLQEKDRMLLNAEKETMRANLMRAMSHDLRTPLTSIIGSSSTYLAQEEYMSPEEKRKLVRNIEEDAQWLLNMVENLLSVTRIQAKKAWPPWSRQTNPWKKSYPNPCSGSENGFRMSRCGSAFPTPSS